MDLPNCRLTKILRKNLKFSVIRKCSSNHLILKSLGEYILRCKRNVVFFRHFKRDAIIDELKNFHNEKVLVFCQTKVTVDILERDLHRKNINCLAIHGDKSQTQRDFALNQFKATGLDSNILIATDVASR